MLLCIVILQRKVFSYFLNLFENLFGEGLILYRTHFGKCFYCLNPCFLWRRLRDDGSSSMWYRFHGIQGSREYLKLPTWRGPTGCFCAENQGGARPLKRLLFQQWKEEGPALFKNMQWLLGRQSLSLKQTRPYVWGVDSEKWGEGSFLKERKKGGLV